MTGCPVGRCADRGDQGEDALQDADGDASTVRPPWRSRSSWPLRVSLTDSMTCRSGLKYWRAAGPGSPLRAGRSRARRPWRARSRSRGRSSALSPMMTCPGLAGRSRRPGCPGGRGARRPSPRPGRTRRAGRAGCRGGAAAAPRTSGNGRRSTRTAPDPASSERLTVSRERAHSTGVESTTQTSSDHRLVLAARTRVQCRTRPRARPQPLVVPGLLRQVREQVPQVRAGVPDPAGLGGEAEQRLHDRQGDQLGIAELRRQADGQASRVRAEEIPSAGRRFSRTVR